MMQTDAIQAANLRAVDLICNADPVLIDVGRADEVLAGFSGRVIAHAGPPVSWDGMSTAQRGGVVAALLYEGWADTPDAALALMASGAVALRPNNDLGAVNPMGGIMSPSSPVFVVKEAVSGLIAVTTLVEGRNPAQRFGSFDAATLERMRWLRDVLAEPLGAAIRATGGIHLREIASQAVQMGDELHQRNLAASSLFYRQLFPALMRVPMTEETRQSIVDYFCVGNEQFFLNLGMAMAKAAMRPIEGLADCTIVTVMARNGVELGIKVAGLGDQWFTGPSGTVIGTYFPSFSAADALPDIGDSAIMETFGLGYFGLGAGGPAFGLLGVPSQEAANARVDQMRKITVGANPNFRAPALGSEAMPCGIDVRLVAQQGIPPGIATAIAHREFGVGRMIGAGLAPAPLAPFQAASAAITERSASATVAGS
jgi:hypothetical protein